MYITLTTQDYGYKSMHFPPGLRCSSLRGGTTPPPRALPDEKCINFYSIILDGEGYRKIAVFVMMVLVMFGCATKSPMPDRLSLQLAPADLGESIALQQHLTVERNGKIDELDAALEIDDSHLQLVGLALGQRVLSLNYDGKKLTSWRHFMLPKQVREEDILEDIQLTFWPLDSIRKALPPGWHIEDSALQRTLTMDDNVVYRINYSSMPRWSGTVKLENYRYHYSLSIQSLPN
jgi:hypothetical protein